jgi:hypothetical protein
MKYLLLPFLAISLWAQNPIETLRYLATNANIQAYIKDDTNQSGIWYSVAYQQQQWCWSTNFDGKFLQMPQSSTNTVQSYRISYRVDQSVGPKGIGFDINFTLIDTNNWIFVKRLSWPKGNDTSWRRGGVVRAP